MVCLKTDEWAIKTAHVLEPLQSKPSTQPLLWLDALFPDVDFLLSKAEKSFGCFARKWRSMLVVWPKYKTVFIQRRHNTLFSSSAWKNDHTMLRFRAAIWESVWFCSERPDRDTQYCPLEDGRSLCSTACNYLSHSSASEIAPFHKRVHDYKVVQNNLKSWAC